MSSSDCTPAFFKSLGSILLTRQQEYNTWNAAYNLCMKAAKEDCTLLKTEVDDKLDSFKRLEKFSNDTKLKCELMNKYAKLN